MANEKKENYDKQTGIDEIVEGDKDNFQNSLTFEDNVIKKIAGIATREVPGVLDMKGGFGADLADRMTAKKDVTMGVSAEVGEKQVAIDLKVILEYGISAPETFEKVKTVVKDQINYMTGLNVVEINMHVNDIMTEKEFNHKKNEDEKLERVE